MPARQIISSEIGFFSKSQEESGVANDFDIESIDQIEIENHVGENEVFTLRPETIAPAPKPAKRQRRKEPSGEVRERTKPRLDQSWRESYITTKKKVGRLQPNHGKRPNFFYAIENNVQHANVRGAAKSAEKILNYGRGPLFEEFFATGIRYRQNAHFICANDYDLTEARSGQYDDAE